MSLQAASNSRNTGRKSQISLEHRTAKILIRSGKSGGRTGKAETDVVFGRDNILERMTNGYSMSRLDDLLPRNWKDLDSVKQ